MARHRKRRASKHKSQQTPSPSVSPAASLPNVHVAAPRAKPKKPKPQQSITDPRDLGSVFAYGPSFVPGVNAWTDNRSEQVRAYKHWVYVAVSTIADAVADQLPNVSFITYRGDPKQKRSPIPLGRLQKALTPLMTHQELEPVPNDHPLLRLFQDPNDPDVATDIWYETVLFLLLTGSAYWWMPRDSYTGLPAAIWPIASHWMWPVFDKNSQIGWNMRPTEGNYLSRFLPIDEVIHFKRKNPISKIDGFSPLSAIGHWVDVADMANRQLFHSFKNGQFPPVAIQFDSNIADPSDEDLRRIEAKWISRIAPEHKTNRPLFLPPGVTVKPLLIKPSEMLFGETSERMRDNILAAYKVPKIVAGLTAGMTYGSNSAAQAGFYMMAVNPLLKFFGQVVTEKLARMYDKDCVVWFESKTPNDPDLTEKQIQTDLMTGSITPNEVRMMRGREPFPYEWANLPIMPVNMQSVTGPLGGSNLNSSPDNDSPRQPRVSEET